MLNSLRFFSLCKKISVLFLKFQHRNTPTIWDSSNRRSTHFTPKDSHNPKQISPKCLAATQLFKGWLMTWATSTLRTNLALDTTIKSMKCRICNLKRYLFFVIKESNASSFQKVLVCWRAPTNWKVDFQRWILWWGAIRKNQWGNRRGNQIKSSQKTHHRGWRW